MVEQVPTAPKAILFDLDGTLVDSATDLAIALKNTFLVMGLKPHSELKVRQWIGNGVNKLIHRGLTNSMDGIAEETEFAKTREIFNEAYMNQIGEESELYPGVTAELENFKKAGIKTACITNKDRNFTLQVLEKIEIKKYFDVVVCGDDLDNKKPSPEPLLFAAKKLSVSAVECLMIGDSKTDVKSANAAGIEIICVDYGYAQGENLKTLKIKAMISSFSEISDCWEMNSYKNCG